CGLYIACLPSLMTSSFFYFSGTPRDLHFSLHDALPILGKAKLERAIELTREILEVPAGWRIGIVPASDTGAVEMELWSLLGERGDRKSTRLNSSHVKISYAVFCLKKKNVCVSCCSC